MSKATKQTDAAVGLSMEGRTFRPAVEAKASAGLKFIKAAELAEAEVTGTIAEGIYEGSLPNTFDSNKSDYKIKLVDGSMAIINGAGNLGYQMKAVNVGDVVRISYNGKQKITKGTFKGRDSHNFTVEVAN